MRTLFVFLLLFISIVSVAQRHHGIPSNWTIHTDSIREWNGEGFNGDDTAARARHCTIHWDSISHHISITFSGTKTRVYDMDPNVENQTDDARYLNGVWYYHSAGGDFVYYPGKCLIRWWPGKWKVVYYPANVNPKLPVRR